MSSKVEVVVSGIGGIFPNCLNLDDFKELLLENMNTAEQAKWVENDTHGNDIYNNLPLKRELLFDSTFFGLHATQVRYLDPLTRMMLEKTFEAIIDAGVNPADVRGKNIPVLLASSVSETDSSLFEPVKNGFGVTGQARSMISNRVSYWLNVNGPSMTLHANWNGSDLVIQSAIAMIQSGMYDAAIVGATNCSEHASVHWLMNERRLLSKDGFTRSFDEQADGYSRGDGVVVFFLQRAELAKRNYTSLLYANSIFNGNREGDFIHCNTEMIHDFLQQCYVDSNIDPKHIAILETFGNGLKHIDEAELAAVERVFCKDRDTPLQIGSVKSNIGHTEPVSSFMSLIKLIVAMETGIIPAHLNYDQPNKNIPALTNGNIEVLTKNKEWSGELAAVNCVGIGSSYSHIILRRNKTPKVDIKTDLPVLLTYSTRSEEGVRKIAEDVETQLSDLSYNYLVHEVFSKNIPGNLYRGYVMKALTDKTDFQHFSGNKPPIWFVYSGMGSQWQTMGRDLMKLPIFAEAVYKCHNTLKPKGIDLLHIITDDDPQIFENILNSFVGIAAVQIGLTDVLNAIGIQPDGIIGHSVGELGCAYADKCLTAEQMILSAYYRGKASLDADLPVGMMAAVGMSSTKLKSFCPPSIDLACHNSAESCTISGPADDVNKFVGVLKSKSIFARLVNVSNIAYHSRYIKPAAPLLLSYLKDLIPEPKARSSKWVSTSVPQSDWKTELARTVSPEYLTNNLLSSVLFEETLPFVPNNAVAIEIAPHGLLQAILKRALSSEVTNVALTKRSTNCLEFLFNSLGQLYLNGLDFNLNPLYPPIPLPVPTGTASLCNLIHWEHGEEWPLRTGETMYNVTERIFSINLRAPDFNHLNDCKTDNIIIVPPALYFGFINEMINDDGNIKDITFEDVVFQNHIEIPPLGIASVTIMVQIGNGYFEVTNEEKIIVTGMVIKNKNEKLPSTQVENNKNTSKIIGNNFYKELNLKGYEFQKEYELVSALSITENGFEATATNTDDWKTLLSTLLQTHLFCVGEASSNTLIPAYIQRVNISFEELKDTEKEIAVWYNSATNILESNNGIHITGIQYKPNMTVKNTIKIENLNFIKICNEDIQEIDYGLNMCMKIVIENLGSENLVITELKEKIASKYLPYIQQYLNQKELNAKTTEINELDYTVLQESSLTIITGTFLNVISRIIANGNNFFLLCFPSSHSICFSNKYSTIAQFTAKNNKFYLLKKSNVNPVKVMIIKNDELSFKNMQANSIPWMNELNTTSRIENSRIYLVSRTIPVEGVQEFVTQMQQFVHKGQNLRFMFILDPSAPECNPEAEFYTRVFEQDLVVQILKNGTWGTFVDVSESLEVSKTYRTLMRAVNSNDFLSGCLVSYLGLHTADLARIDDDNIPCEVGPLDFAGTRSAGDRVMGFAQTDLEHNNLTTDPSFVWPVPKNWTLCDAATVPYSYTLAYYALFTVGDLSKCDAVLVHAGCSEIGQAALHVAYNYGCKVFTTVANERQKAILKKMMPLIPDENIMNSETTHFELEVLDITKGHGVDILVNCLPGKRLHISKNILTGFSRFIQLGSADLNQYATMGSKFFLTCTSFHGVTGQHLLRLDHEVKRQLHEMVSEGIRGMVVVPMRRKIFTENRVDDSLRYLRSMASEGAAVMQVNSSNFENSTLVSKALASVHQFVNQDSYLIYADAHDSWLLLVKWLVKHGAKRIIIANQYNQNYEFINRHLSIIRQNYKTEIVISKHNATTLKNANALSNEVGLVGCMKDIFIFATNAEDFENNNFDDNIFRNIDIAFTQNKLVGRMVCMLGPNKENSYIRENGLPVCNIMWDDAYSLQDVIKNFDAILTEEDKRMVLLKDESVEIDESKEEVDIAEDYSMFVPNSLKSFKQLGQNDLTAPNIVQLGSSCPKEMRELLPVFLVPGLAGLNCPDLKQFIRQMMYPMFCVNLPATTLQDDIVAHLAQQILQVQDCKVYKLIGLSWGGILAVEIAKHLENLGKKIELHLIDGDTKVIQNFTNIFYKSGAFNTTLLKHIINVDGKNMENILASNDLTQFDYKDIIKSLTILKNLIEYSNFYKPLPNQISGPTTIIMPDTVYTEESSGLREHCAQIEYKIMRGNHRTILQNPSVIEFINDNLVL